MRENFNFLAIRPRLERNKWKGLQRSGEKEDGDRRRRKRRRRRRRRKRRRISLLDNFHFRVVKEGRGKVLEKKWLLSLSLCAFSILRRRSKRRSVTSHKRRRHRHSHTLALMWHLGEEKKI